MAAPRAFSRRLSESSSASERDSKRCRLRLSEQGQSSPAAYSSDSSAGSLAFSSQASSPSHPSSSSRDSSPRSRLQLEELDGRSASAASASSFFSSCPSAPCMRQFLPRGCVERHRCPHSHLPYADLFVRHCDRADGLSVRDLPLLSPSFRPVLSRSRDGAAQDSEGRERRERERERERDDWYVVSFPLPRVARVLQSLQGRDRSLFHSVVALSACSSFKKDSWQRGSYSVFMACEPSNDWLTLSAEGDAGCVDLLMEAVFFLLETPDSLLAGEERVLALQQHVDQFKQRKQQLASDGRQRRRQWQDKEAGELPDLDPLFLSLLSRGLDLDGYCPAVSLSCPSASSTPSSPSLSSDLSPSSPGEACSPQRQPASPRFAATDSRSCSVVARPAGVGSAYFPAPAAASVSVPRLVSGWSPPSMEEMLYHGRRQPLSALDMEEFTSWTSPCLRLQAAASFACLPIPAADSELRDAIAYADGIEEVEASSGVEIFVPRLKNDAGCRRNLDREGRALRCSNVLLSFRQQQQPEQARDYYESRLLHATEWLLSLCRAIVSQRDT